MLLAFLEEELETETQTEKSPSAFDRGAHGRLEARLEEAVHRRLKGGDAGQDQPPGRRHAVEVGREVHLGAEAPERPDHRSRVADPVVDERDGRTGRGGHAVSVPFVEGTSVPVIAMAWRSARAADLKTASAA